MRVELVRAWPHRSERVVVDLPASAQACDALIAANWRLDAEFVALAIFGRAASLQTPLHEGDRVELLRALRMDPKQARRKRAERAARRG